MTTGTKRKRAKRAKPVWRREGTPETGFTYVRETGRPVRARADLERVRALAIPPAWTAVEIAADPKARVQATGFDARGRKQYRYHAGHVARRSRRKFRKLGELARALPRVREETDRHLRLEGQPRERVLATIVRLMLRGFFRVGSERYAVENKTFGITTLRKRHLRVEGTSLHFRYVGKSAVHQRQVVAETPLAAIMAEVMELPGTRLFRYVDAEGAVRDVTARDVNDYIRQVAGAPFSSKDLRTWGGTVRAATILAELGPAKSAAEAKRNVVLACRLVSAELGNTPSVCRSAYVHPVVLEKYQTGKTIAPYMREAPRSGKEGAPAQFYPEEAALMRFLERWT